MNKQLTRSSESSEKLTKALNKITLWGAIIAGIGVSVALTSLIFEIYKFFIQK